MPEKDWIVWLDRACRVEVERHSRGGRMIGFRIVLLADIDGEIHCVTRYDTSHGFAHRDILAFEQAYLDIVSNHGRYLGDYRGKGG